MRNKYKIGVIGATGMAGQQFMESLVNHPWFEIDSIFGHNSVGKKFGDSIRGLSNFNYPPEILDLKVKDSKDIESNNIDIFFSAIPSNEAKEIEGKLAKTTPVISTASAYRYKDDVPIFLPIINGEHYKLLDVQKENRNWEGFIVPGPNCTTVGLCISLYPIYKKFGIKCVHMSSMQAISGAGYPGVPAYDIVANVIPHIAGEEEKVIIETKKILGTFQEKKIQPLDFQLDCKCNRVPSINGHMENVFIETIRPFEKIQEIKDIWINFAGYTAEFDLPNSPRKPIRVFEDPYLPQPRINLQNGRESGMTTYIGGIEKTVFKNGIKYTVLSHNTELGAGRGGVLSAEYLVAKGYI
ncbi:MAG: aspartate-semialdehyde dehydrogenase [Candidatus Lokiarchaeota archaeon]